MLSTKSFIVTVLPFSPPTLYHWTPWLLQLYVCRPPLCNCKLDIIACLESFLCRATSGDIFSAPCFENALTFLTP